MTKWGRAVLRRLRSTTRVWCPVFAAACGRAEPASTASSAPKAVEASSELDAGQGSDVDAGVIERRSRPARSLGRFHVTMYYVAEEEHHAPVPRARATAADVNLASAAPSAAAEPVSTPTPIPEVVEVDRSARDRVPVNDRKCKPIVHVHRAFRQQLLLQGTGRLRDGRVLNVASRCKCAPCFHVLPANRPWGMAGTGIPLEPFRTVAVDPNKIRLGALLYIPALDGMRMPGPEPVGGFIHDGCVLAADTGGNIDGRQLDLFVARRAYFNGLKRRNGDHKWLNSIEVFEGKGRCERKNGKVSQSRAGAT